MVLSAKMVGAKMAMKDLDKKTYWNLVRFDLYSTTMWADVDMERNIMSSNVEFLEGRNTIGNDEGSREKNLPDIGEASFVLDKEWVDYDLERNITSSDVEFLEGRMITDNDEGSGEKNLPDFREASFDFSEAPLDLGEASFVLDKNVG